MSAIYTKYKKEIIIAITLIVISILIISAIVVSINLTQTKATKEEENTFEYDDRISPYTNQALIVEILRIRNRESLDKLMTIGNSWFVLDWIIKLQLVAQNLVVNKKRPTRAGRFQIWNIIFVVGLTTDQTTV